MTIIYLNDRRQSTSAESPKWSSSFFSIVWGQSHCNKYTLTSWKSTADTCCTLHQLRPFSMQSFPIEVSAWNWDVTNTNTTNKRGSSSSKLTGRRGFANALLSYSSASTADPTSSWGYWYDARYNCRPWSKTEWETDSSIKKHSCGFIPSKVPECDKIKWQRVSREGPERRRGCDLIVDPSEGWTWII